MSLIKYINSCIRQKNDDLARNFDSHEDREAFTHFYLKIADALSQQIGRKMNVF